MNDRNFHLQLITFFRYLFALHLLYSGAAYIFFGWVPSAFFNPASPVGQFMVELDRIGLYGIVKHIEFGCGLLLLVNRFVPLAAVIEMPISVMIAYLNIVVEGQHAPRHYYTGLQELALNGVVLLGYGAYYRSMLVARAKPLWLWQNAQGAGTAEEQGAEGRSGPLGTWQMWLAFGVILGVILTASWMLGPPDRKLPPRDWVPPVAAFVLMLVSVRFMLPGMRAQQADS